MNTANNNNNNNNKAKNNDLAISSSHRCCAERRLLDTWVAKARRRGMARHQIVTWVRRKVGAHVTVFRTLADGTLACAAPCLLCQRELVRFDLRVHCSLSPEQWWSGRLTDATAPPGKLTARQRMTMPCLDPHLQDDDGPAAAAAQAAAAPGGGGRCGGSTAAGGRRGGGRGRSGGRPQPEKRQASPA